MCDMSERLNERAKKFSNVDNHQKRPTPELAEARQQALHWSGCRKRCQRHTGNRLQSTSAFNESRDGIGREESPQSNVTSTSGALIGRKKRCISSASAKEERLFPEFEFEGGIFATARAVASRVASMATSIAASMATSVLHFPINPSGSLHRHGNRRLGLLTALLIPTKML